MKILIDESLPRYLQQVLQDYDAYTVQYMGWSGIKFCLCLSEIPKP